MPRISIEHRHGLSHEKAKSAADRIAKDLEKRFHLAYAWEGEEVRFQRPGLSGTMLVGKTHVRLDVELSFLLAALKGPIEKEIHKKLENLFGEA